MKKPFILLTLAPLLLLSACNKGGSDNVDPTPDPTPVDPVDPDPVDPDPVDPDPVDPDPVKTTVFDSKTPGKNKTYEALSEYTPTLFLKDSVNINSTEVLGDGVNHYVYSFKLNNENNVYANVVEVDLTKATIATNYSKSGVATPYSQLQNYESSTNKKVMSIINADFFATGYGPCVNAYVKDNEIIKAGHNDKGIYDYTNLDADIPASKAMLLGISGDSAKIAPIIENGTIEETIKAQFSYSLTYLNSSSEEVTIKENVSLNTSTFSSTCEYLIINEDMSVTIPTDYKIYKFEKTESNTRLVNGKYLSVSKQKLEGKKKFSDTDTYFYVICKDTLELDVNENSKILYSVNSSDDTWLYYSDVIGGRQSLVENGEIASTVTLENSNGAQRSNIPRSAVGVKDASTVYIVAIEALRYSNKSTSDDDSYGVSLPELAEFMRYIGCYDAMNFDGGGSTQLLTKNDNGNGDITVNVRSSDYGTYDASSSRKVYNTLIVSTK